VHDRSRQIEYLSESGAQAGGAHALHADDRIAFEHDRRYAGA
jgi:hypothetical protein